MFLVILSLAWEEWSHPWLFLCIAHVGVLLHFVFIFLAKFNSLNHIWMPEPRAMPVVWAKPEENPEPEIARDLPSAILIQSSMPDFLTITYVDLQIQYKTMCKIKKKKHFFFLFFFIERRGSHCLMCIIIKKKT